MDQPGTSQALGFKTPKRRVPRPPGPPGLPFIGQARLYGHDPLAFYRKVCDQYGSLVYHRTFGIDFYVLSDPGLIEHVLVKNQRNYHKDPFVMSWRAVFGQGLLTSHDEAWKQERKRVQPSFHRDRIPVYSELMRRSTENTLSRWTTGQEISVQREMMALTLDIVVRALFGAEIEPEQMARAGRGLDRITRYFEWTTTLWGAIFGRAPNWQRWRYLKAVAELEEIVLDIISQRRKERLALGENGQGDERGDLLSSLLAEYDSMHTQEAEKQLRDEIMTLFLAGHETTALALTYSIFLVAKNPIMQDLVAEGQVSVKQVLEEALRMYPPAWVLGRQALADDEIGGYSVPQGAMIVVPIHAIHHSERFYRNPDEFRPERWTDELRHELPRAAYLPFGFGPRMCVGASFAMTEAEIILGEVLKRFRLELIGPESFKQQGSITARPKAEIRVRLESR